MPACQDPTRLWNRYNDTHSQEARNALVEYYMPLVHKRACLLVQRLPGCITEDDLCSAGYEGLIQAVEAYDAGRNVAFEAFCQKRILGAMCDWLRQMSHHSRTIQSFLTRSNRVRDSLSAAYGRRVLDEEVAAQMGMKQSRFNSLSRIARNEKEIHMSTLCRQPDAGHGGDSTDTSWEVMDFRHTDPASKTTRELLLQSITKDLSREEQLILTLYYYEELTLKEIGAVLDLSESRVSQMLTRLLRRLRARLARNPEYQQPGYRPSFHDVEGNALKPAYTQTEVYVA